MSQEDIIMLTSKELKRLKVIQEAISKHITQKEASSLLALSQRQIANLVQRVRKEGDCGEMLDGTLKTSEVDKKTDEALDKIKEESGCGLIFVSLIIPGSGQMAKGEVGKGILFLVLAIGLGIISYGVLAVVVAIISAIDAASPIYKCPKCKEIIKYEATVCKYCGRDLSVKSQIRENYKSSSAIPIVGKLAILRERLGNDVVCFADITEKEWICVCGTRNELDMNKKIQNCSKCHRNRDVTLEQYKEENFKY